jgi:hypothetical protein
MFRLRVAGLESASRFISRFDGASLVSIRPGTRNSLANISKRFTSSSNEISNEELTHPVPTRFAVVEHGDIYIEEMRGGHGQQLSLAYEESLRGQGKYLPDDLLDQYATSLDEVIARSSSPLSEPAEQGESDIDREDDAEEMEEDDAEEEGEEFDEETVLEQYNNDGTPMISREDRIAYKAGAPAGGNFAIINLNGSQHKVTVDDVVVVDKLKPVSKWKVGETIVSCPTDMHDLATASLCLANVLTPNFNFSPPDAKCPDSGCNRGIASRIFRAHACWLARRSWSFCEDVGGRNHTRCHHHYIQEASKEAFATQERVPKRSHHVACG